MTSTDITQRRLVNQRIASNTTGNIAELVAHLGAMQAQDYEGALWAISLRVAGSTRHDIEQVIAERKIVRTWPMRGTLHFVAAQDIRWMLKLLAPRSIAGQRLHDQQLELDEKTYARCYKALVSNLQGDHQLTRNEAMLVLEREGIATKGQRGYHILKKAAQDGLICFGMPRGRQQTFALLDEWVTVSQDISREEALAKLAQQYFASHGPATLRDFVWWSGLLVADARAGLEAVKAQFSELKIEDQTYLSPGNISNQRNGSSEIYLLPGFDEYMLGYRDRGAALAPHHSQKIVPGNNGVFLPTIVIGGKIAGLWTRKIKAKSVAITSKPFEPLSPAQQSAFRAAAERYSAFLGLPASFD